MPIITRRITNNLNYQFTIPCPGDNNNQNANLVIPASVVNLDLLTLTTEDNLWTLQPQLLSLQRVGAISVTGTLDTAQLDYDGVSSLHADANPELMGDVQLVSGTNISLSQVGHAITVNATGSGTPALPHLQTFAGNGSNVATATSILQVDLTHNSIGINTAPDTTGTYAIQQLNGASYFKNLWCHDFWVEDYVFAGICYIGTLYGATLDQPTYIGSNGDSLQGIILQDAELVPILTVDTINKIVGIGVQPDVSAKLDVQSTTQGFLPPRMSDPTTAIVSPAEGLIAYSTSTHHWLGYNGTTWVQLDN